MRSLFTGHVTFGLITIPVGVYSALEASERVGFRLFHRKDTIDVLQFVDFVSLNPLSFDKPYDLAPGKGGEKAWT